MKSVSASDANRHFSALLREVSTGESINVISRGKWVATISPPGQRIQVRENAKTALLERLKSENVTGERNWTRDDLYDGGL